MKTTLKNLKNDNTETFKYISFNEIADFVNKELGIDDDNETGFTYLYKTLGELSFQSKEIQRYIIDGLSRDVSKIAEPDEKNIDGLIRDVSKIAEPDEKNRYNLCLLKLLANIDNIIDDNDYIGDDDDTFLIEHLECYRKMKSIINIISFLKALDIEMTTTGEI